MFWSPGALSVALSRYNAPAVHLRDGASSRPLLQSVMMVSWYFFSIKLQTTDRLYHDSINVGHSSLFFCPSLSVDESWVHFSKKGKSRDQYSSWLAHWHALYIVQRKRRKSTTIKRNFRNFPRKPMQMRLNKILIGVQSCSFQDFFLQQDKVYCIGYIYMWPHM
jgi:hypothetical protein